MLTLVQTQGSLQVSVPGAGPGNVFRRSSCDVRLEIVVVEKFNVGVGCNICSSLKSVCRSAPEARQNCYGPAVWTFHMGHKKGVSPRYSSDGL